MFPIIAALTCSASDTSRVTTAEYRSPRSSYVPTRDPFSCKPAEEQKAQRRSIMLREIRLKEIPMEKWDSIPLKKPRERQGDFWYPPQVERLC
jgi:hypothetical protein